MNAFRRRYGASVLHLLLTLCSWALAGYAGVRLLNGDTLGVVIWFVGAAVLHDLVLLPVYGVLDRALQGVTRRRGGRRAGGGTAVNYVRVPVFLSGLLLLVWFPLVLRLVGHYTAATGLPADRFWEHWLLITAALFALSALCYVARSWRRRPAVTDPPDSTTDARRKGQR
ncbi:hypothetical protein POF50_015635 [Streptomyces sp. SL13]|uniref:Uncharacterized protein n=1 Tax=Streptantibioticus silvisoli TaxID=2705255 RepID=A0AA90KGW4_9ACTN|nr:hypothetical protein [Streptantibioticus silvisoli]MDI5970754.1 hypothetical protein [Streptantibioticus silvisoli]